MVAQRSLCSLFCHPWLQNTPPSHVKKGQQRPLLDLPVSTLKGGFWTKRKKFENSGLGIKVEGEVVSLNLKRHDPEIQAAEAVL